MWLSCSARPPDSSATISWKLGWLRSITLREIGRDFPDLTAAVFDLLSAYVKSKSFDYGDAEPPPDVAALFEILTARTKAS
jgi:hypothetical protein